MSWLNLTSRVAVVTGANSGIGLNVASLLSSHGATVIAADRTTFAGGGEVGRGGKRIDVKGDIAEEGDIERIFNIADGEGGASILVNCAGITRDGWLNSMSLKDFDDVISVNLRGTWLTCREFSNPSRLSQLAMEGRHGSIVNIASVVGEDGNLGQSNYAASKAGVMGLTKTVAKEMARSNVRCNTVLPGFIKTPMTDAVPEKVMAGIVGKIGMRRFGRTEEIADAVAWLASERSSYVTGQCIRVDGDISM